MAGEVEREDLEEAEARENAADLAEQRRNDEWRYWNEVEAAVVEDARRRQLEAMGVMA